ncbi:SOS response-associated peptidase [Pseudooceanicola aestuarii]|uniref:SOS response-associated peptidase n=1 Tax=Pseudooceanicola aestuarii TaxID=2697319 RepID=UPI0013D8D3EF|nr:SOS response-associated peptidase [Pseudooceanicola aestuarii]
MCGRFAFTLPDQAMAQLFAATPGNDLPSAPDFNVCPTAQIVTVVGGGTGAGEAAEEGQSVGEAPRRLVAMRWGFVPHWYKTPGDGPLLINARAETIAEKPAFRAACRARRCLIPVTGFYEWERHDRLRLPWFAQRSDDTPLVMAGIWQDWEGPEGPMTTCAIVTTQAEGEIAAIHHRMPVILDPRDWPLWLGEAGHGAARLMRPAPGGTLRLYRVDRAVNSNRAAGPELIEPLEPEAP